LYTTELKRRYFEESFKIPVEKMPMYSWFGTGINTIEPVATEKHFF